MRNNICIISVICTLLASCNQEEMQTMTDCSGKMQQLTLTAALPEEMTTRTAVTDENKATRCYVQILKSDGSELPEGESYVREMTKDENTGNFNLTIQLNPDSLYDFLFWADNNNNSIPPVDLKAVDYTADGKTIAFAAKTEDYKFTQYGLETTLKHVVTRISIESTAAVPIESNNKLTVNIPKCYTQYNVSTMKPGMEKTDFTYSNFTAVTEPAGGHMGHFYVLGDADQTANSTLTLTYSNQEKKMTNVPLKPNYHITLKGDVALTRFDFTVNVEENWNSSDKIDEIGDGYYIKDGIYYIFNANGLYAWAKAVEMNPTLSCTLVDNIYMPSVNADESNWTALCMVEDESQAFNGVFDGNGYTITGLQINKPDEVGGLFGIIGPNGKVQNLKLSRLNINANSSAGVALGNYGYIINCSVNGNITGSAMGGGIVVQNMGHIIACSTSGNVISSDVNNLAGGITGLHCGSMIACYFNGTSTGSGIVDAIMPYDKYNPTVTTCFWGGNAVGGFRVDISDNTASNSEQIKKVDGTKTTWANAMTIMNEALAKDPEGSKWKYVENTDVETKDDMPLIIIPRTSDGTDAQ